MEINLADLELGDEFLYAVHGNLVRAKVIRPVQPKKVQPTYGTQGKTYYKSVKCKVAVKEITYSYGVFKEYNASDNYTVEKYVDLNYRNIWLVKKGKQ